MNPRLIQFLVVLSSLSVFAGPSAAQDVPSPAEHQHPAAAAAGAWAFSWDGNLFYGFDKQQRKYADFSAWESQNWGMAAASRRLGAGLFRIEGMLSLEPFTIDALGSPQLFQTGESYQQVPLVNYQHPHDLLMAFGGAYRVERERIAYQVGAALVGSPALGPTAFMHRESARNNPQAPVSHHSLDSTHMSQGVVTFGVTSHQVTVEASAFRGEEPDENRLNVERPALNSWSARVGWRRGPWDAQFSGGRLHEPEWFEPYDHTRLTASVGFTGTIARRPLAAFAAWGQNRVNNGFANVDDSYLLEWDFRPLPALALYGRAEHAQKQILGLGVHPKGFSHPHFYALVEPVTIGVVRDLPLLRGQRLGLGADVTFYRMSSDMIDYYDGSHSYHVFLRWRPASVSAPHLH